MNTFYEHHKDSIRFQYACFDRILLYATILLTWQTVSRGQKRPSVAFCCRDGGLKVAGGRFAPPGRMSARTQARR